VVVGNGGWWARGGGAYAGGCDAVAHGIMLMTAAIAAVASRGVTVLLRVCQLLLAHITRACRSTNATTRLLQWSVLVKAMAGRASAVTGCSKLCTAATYPPVLQTWT
jgi:hypothetical protein